MWGKKLLFRLNTKCSFSLLEICNIDCEVLQICDTVTDYVTVTDDDTVTDDVTVMLLGPWLQPKKYQNFFK